MYGLIDFIIIIAFVLLIFKLKNKGLAFNWLYLSYNVVGLSLATIVSKKLVSSLYFKNIRLTIASALSKSNLIVDLPVGSNSKFPNTNLPQELNELFRQHYELLNNQQESIWVVSEKIIVNILGALACYLMIWLAIQIAFFAFNKYVIKVNHGVIVTSSKMVILPAVANTLLCFVILSGVLAPFIILFGKIGLVKILESSFLLKIFAKILYSSFTL